MLEQYKGKEEAMMKALVKKYGPEPEAPDGAASPSAAAAAPAAAPKPAAAAAPVVDWKARITTYCNKNCPENVPKIDGLLKKFAGNEEKMMQDLIKKYGPEPTPSGADAAPGSPIVSPRSVAAAAPPAAAAGSASGGSSDVMKARLVRFLQKYEPTKVGTADKMLEQYKGKEEAMMKAFVKKYGPEPEAPDGAPASPAPAAPVVSPIVAAFTMEQRIRRLVKKYQSDKYEQVPAMMEKYKGKEEQLIASLVKKFGPEPTEALDIGDGMVAAPEPRPAKAPYNNPFPPRERLVRFYTKYQQDKLAGDTVEKALKKYEGDEELMFATLVKKYGPEPLPDEVLPPLASGSQAPPPSTPAGIPDPTNPYEARLIRFYQKYQPDKLSNVAKALETYKGREETMFETLVKKYGAEPLPDEVLPPVPGTQPAGAATPAAAPNAPPPAATASTNPYEARLIRFYQKYQPDKLNNVAKALETFKGREEAMFETLVKKYGPEPPQPVDEPSNQAPVTVVAPSSPVDQPPASSSSSSSSSLPPTMPLGSDHRNRLIRIYMRYATEKSLTDVDKALTQFQGREAVMFDMLVKKYGPEPPEPSVEAPPPPPTEAVEAAPPVMYERERRQLTTLFEKFAPDRVFQINALIDAFAPQRVGDLVRAAHAEYGAPFIPEMNRGSSSTLFGKYPTSDSATGIVGAGKLTVCVHTARSIPYSDAAQALNVFEQKAPSYEAVLVFAGKDLFRVTGRESTKERGVVVFPDGADNTFLLLLDGTEFLVTIRLYRDNRFLGEARMTLAALPHVGTVEFRLDPRMNELDPYILGRNGDLGLLDVDWSFVSNEFLVHYRNRKLELLGSGDAAGGERALTAAADAPYAEDPWHQRLAAMFCRYLPEKLQDIPFVLSEHRGRENELLDSLSLKFGAEPDPRDFQASVERIFYVYDKPRVRESKLFATQSIGREATVMRSLAKKYGEVPAVLYAVPPIATRATHGLVDAHRVRLTRWFMLRCPRRVSEVDYFLVRFLGREQVMFSMLREVLGPEPSDLPPEETLRSRYLVSPALRHYFGSRRAPPFLKWMWMEGADRATANAAAADIASTRNNSSGDKSISAAAGVGGAPAKESMFTSNYIRYRNRLERFYKHYNPVKIVEVEDTLQRWRGKEELLFEALVHKYGGEPAVELPARDIPVAHQQQLGKLSPQLAAGGSLESMEKRGRLRHDLERVYSVSNPDKLRTVEETLNRFRGREEVLENMVAAKYGGGTRSPEASTSARGNAMFGGGQRSSVPRSSPSVLTPF